MEIKKVSRNTTLLSFFFNARGSQLERSTVGLYRSLLVQFLQEHRSDEQVWHALSLAQWVSDEQIQTNTELLKQLLAQAIQLPAGRDIKLVIDALDECVEDEVRDMVSFFTRLGRDMLLNGRKFHVFFSSRHYPHITIPGSLEMKLEYHKGHSQDIERYISGRN